MTSRLGNIYEVFAIFYLVVHQSADYIGSVLTFFNHRCLGLSAELQTEVAKCTPSTPKSYPCRQSLVVHSASEHRIFDR